MTNAQKIIDHVDAAEARLEACVAAITPEAVVHHDSGWTARDIVAHLAAWNWQMLLSIAAHLRGERYAIKPFVNEQQNWAFYRAALAQPWQAVHAEWLASHREVRALARRLSAEQLAQTTTAPWGSEIVIEDLLEDVAVHAEAHLREMETARG